MQQRPLWRLQRRPRALPESTRASLSSPNPSACVTRHTLNLLPPNLAWSAADSRPIPITCGLRSRGRSALRLATSSPSRYAAVIIDRCIRPAMKSLGGKTCRLTLWKSQEGFGSKRIRQRLSRRRDNDHRLLCRQGPDKRDYRKFAPLSTEFPVRSPSVPVRERP